MTGTLSAQIKRPSADTIFRIFKYSVYCLLAWNVWMFFQEDLAASAETFGDTVTWRNVVEAYSATIDTLAWVILLLLFELETGVIDDEKLRGGIKWVFTGIRVACYFFITYAFYGYCVKYGLVSDVVPFTVSDVCKLVGSSYSYIDDLDEYLAVTPQACEAMRGHELFRISDTEIVGTAAAVDAAVNLAIIDIINAGDWLIIVILLEVEVYLQLKKQLTDRMLAWGKYIKGFFYLLLFFCAGYWWFKGDFLDFWDAFLWLVAFIFIELNVFQWHEENEESDLASRELDSA
jgi:hypothetical protein